MQKKIFTLKKVPRKPLKKKNKPQNTSIDPIIEDETPRRPFKLFRSHTFDLNEKPGFSRFHPPKNKLLPPQDSDLMERYSFQLQNFIINGYSFVSEAYLRRLIQNSETLTSEIQLRFNLPLILRSLIKCFMMNQLEMVFLSCFLEGQKWNYLPCIATAARIEKFPEIVKLVHETDKSVEYKGLILYLCFACFAIKNLLRDQYEIMVFRAFINTRFGDLSKPFFDWYTENEEWLKFDLVTLNHVFEKNSFSWQNSVIFTDKHGDMDSLVNTILEMSPPYLYEKSDDEKPRKYKCETAKDLVKSGLFVFSFPLNSLLEFKETERLLLSNTTLFKEVEPKESDKLPRSNTLLFREYITDFDNQAREENSLRRMPSRGYSRFMNLNEDFFKQESNLSIFRGGSFRSDAGGFGILSIPQPTPESLEFKPSSQDSFSNNPPPLT